MKNPTTQAVKEHQEEVFAEVMASTGKPAEAIKASHPKLYEHNAAVARNHANRLLKKRDVQAKIQLKLERMQPKALKTINKLIMSDDEGIATQNAWRVVEQLRGKPVARNLNLNAKVTIEDVLFD